MQPTAYEHRFMLYALGSALEQHIYCSLKAINVQLPLLSKGSKGAYLRSILGSLQLLSFFHALSDFLRFHPNF